MKSGQRTTPVTISSLEDLQFYDFRVIGHRGPTLATKVVLLENGKGRFRSVIEVPLEVYKAMEHEYDMSGGKNRSVGAQRHSVQESDGYYFDRAT